MLPQNPLAELAEHIYIKSKQGHEVIAIMIHPITYFQYMNNPFVAGIKQTPEDFAAFPTIKRIFNNRMNLNKIALVTDENMIDFMREV